MANQSILLDLKNQVADLENYATFETIEKATLLIREITKYISVNIASSDVKDQVYDELEIMHNYLKESKSDGNDTMMILVKRTILSNIDKLLENFSNSIALNSRNEKDNFVFIVHGHDDTMKLAVSDAIRSLGLSPIILHEEVNRGRTIIEKFEEAANKVGFAVILISPDDCVNIDKEQPFRARQNVILELGYFCGKYGRNNVFVLCDTKEKTIELPSDILGLLYDEYDQIYGQWRFRLAKSLREAGYDIDLNQIL